MSKKKSKTKQNRDQKARSMAQNNRINNMPMNKEFLNATNEDGSFKYPIVNKLVKYKMLDLERIYDIMRQISAFVAQVRHHQNRIKRLTEQYESGNVIEKDEYGRLYTKEELHLQIISEKINIPREISRIREHAVDKLLPLVDGIRFTGTQYNEYICKVNETIKDLGEKLFPDKIELNFSDFE